MKTLRKFSLFMVLGALLVVLGCEEKKARPDTPADDAKAGEDAEIDVDAPGSLEARCFEGDPSACDDLGH